jgi:hypothetical protein
MLRFGHKTIKNQAVCGQVDINGDPILVLVNVTPSMTPNGARLDYHVTERLFARDSLGRSQGNDTSYEVISGGSLY